MKNETREKYLLKNTIIFFIGNFASKFISFFLVPLYTNVLSTTEYGIIDLLTILCTLIVPITTLNISEGVIRFFLDKDSNENKIMSIGIKILLFSTIFSLIYIPIIKCISTLSNYAILFYFYTVTFCYSQFFLYSLRGKEKLMLYSFGNIMQTFFIGIFNIIFLTIFNWGIKGYFLAYIISNLLVSIYGIILNKFKIKLIVRKIDKQLFKDMIVYSVFLIPNALMWWIMDSLDKMMITYMMGTAANGIYAISYKLPTLVSNFTTIFNQAWSYSAIRENNSIDKETYNNNILKNLFNFVIIISLFLLAILKPFLKIYVGNSFYDSWKYSPFLIVGFVFLSLGGFVATPYTVNKDSFGFLKSSIIGVIINVILNLLLINKIGIYGAAIATCISYIAVFIFRVFDTRKYLKFKFFNFNYFIGILLLIISFIGVYIQGIISYVILGISFIIAIYYFRGTLFGVIHSILKK